MQIRIIAASGLLIIYAMIFIACTQAPSSEQMAETNLVETSIVSDAPIAGNTSEATSTPGPTFTPTPTATPSLEQSLHRNPPVPLRDEAINVDTVSRVGPLQTWKRGRFLDAAYSPDGTLLAIGSSSEIYLQDADTLMDVGYIGTQNPVEALAFSADSQIIATTSLSETISLWSVNDSTLIRVLEGHTSPVTSIAAAADSQLLASGAEGGTVIIWNMTDGGMLHTLEGHVGTIDSLAFSPDGQTLVSASQDNTFRIWNTDNGQTQFTYEWEERELQPAALHDTSEALSITVFSPDGQQLALAHQDTITLWDIENEQVLQTSIIPDPWARIYSLAFNPTGETIATGYLSSSGAENPVYREQLTIDRSEVALWNVSDGSFVDTIGKHRGADLITGLSFHPNSGEITWVSSEQATVYDVEESQQRQTLVALAFSGWMPTFSPSGNILADVYGQVDKDIALWRIADGELLQVLQLPPDYINPADRVNAVSASVNTISFSPDEQLIAVSTSDPNWKEGVVGVWSVPDGQFLYSLETVAHYIAFSPDSTLLATSDRGKINLWSAANGQMLAELTYDDVTQRDGVANLIFSPDGTVLAASATGGAWGANGGMVNLWSALDGEIVQSMEIAPSGLTSDVAFSPDGTVLAASGGFIVESGMQTLKLWSIPDGQILHEINYTGGLGRILFGPDGKTIAMETLDLNSETPNHIHIRSVLTGDILYVFRGDIVGYTPDGSILMAREINTINFWDTSSGEVVHSLESSTDSPLFSPDGKLLIDTFNGAGFLGVTDQIVPTPEGMLDRMAETEDTKPEEDVLETSTPDETAGEDAATSVDTDDEETQAPSSQDFPAQDLQAILNPVDGTIGAVIYDLTRSQSLYTQNEDRVFSAASLVKLPIAFTAYTLADRGDLNLDETLTLAAGDIVGGTGSIQNSPVGSVYTIRDLCARMLYDSDNTAANMVLAHVGGLERVNETLVELGMTNTQAQRFLMDVAARQEGRDNLTSPADMAEMLRLLAQNEVAGANELMAALTQTNDLQKIPALLPGDVVVANKTGVLPAPSGVEHDVAVVTVPDGRKYVLVLMAQDLSNNQTAIAAMAEASRIVYEYYQGAN